MLRKIICAVVVVLLACGIGLKINSYSALLDIFGLLQCHRGHHTPHKYLATKTPYLAPSDAVLGHHHSHSHGNCEPVLIWMVVRHGTRNPSAKVIKKMRTVLPTVRDQIIKAHESGLGILCPNELNALSNWNPPTTLTESEEKKLVAQGEVELRGIGQRFRKRFPNLLSKKYHNDTHKFKYTKTERADASCKFFVEELVGRQEAPKVWFPEPLAADPILRFYKGCPKWKKEVDKNPEAYSERKKFETSAAFESVQRNIGQRSGLNGPVELDIVEAMYMTCAFETAWTPPIPSPWCHLFDEEDLEKMQYRQDLEYYWIDGYGFELTYKQACPAVKDLVHHVKLKIEGGDKSPHLVAYFTHSGTLLKLISRFGLFNDSTPLLHNNFHLHTTRQWRTSEIDKFATNIAAVLYKCSNDYRIGFLFQEQPVPIPSCGDDLCPIEKFLTQYASVINDCDMPTMCSV